MEMSAEIGSGADWFTPASLTGDGSGGNVWGNVGM